ncbi:MAG: D-alanine--D-alanine ligase [Lachnospiraceae bacterium]|nr:D-alanine--D-alanine ligase [Lachnospiraceae bacterium]
MAKKNLAIVFGGRSSEHDVSCVSVVTIAKAIAKDKFNVYLIGITKEGHWKYVSSIDEIEDGSWRESEKAALISPDAKGEMMIVENNHVEHVKLDVVFPALHGKYGEDGTIQGLFEMANIPYVGCGVLASAASMDKIYTKLIVDTLGIRQAQYVPVLKEQLCDMDGVVARVEEKLSYPVFVKPSKAGSSVGVTKAVDRKTLEEGLILASKHDYKILVEETIVGRELECAVLGYGDKTKASCLGEIIAAADFYDYDAKYNNEESKTIIDPELPEGKSDEIRANAVRIFNAVDGFGLSRVDFFLEKDTNCIVFNEINTLPGFTSISMYPMLWGANGYPIDKLVEVLIEMAMERP